MTDNAALQEEWQNVVNELLLRSETPTSPIPRLTHQQRGILTQVSPVAIVNGYVVLSTSSKWVKRVIEDELSSSIVEVISDLKGIPCSLAVSLRTEPAAASPKSNASHGSQTSPASQDSRYSQQQPSVGASRTTAAPRAEQTHQHHQSHEAHELQTGIPDHSHSSPAAARSPHHPGTSYPPASAADSSSLSREDQRGYQSRFSFQQDDDWQVTHIPTSAAFPHQHSSAAAARAHAHQPGQRMKRERPAVDPDRKQSLNPRFTFESFVIGSSNKFANSAAVAVAETPAKAYNPLFIWGGSGLGKTHLLHATGNYALELQPELRIKYVSSEEFTNDFINSVRDDRQESFKARYRNLDILMVDDIQFLQDKETTQEEFFHTFNALHQANKQIILTSDRPPKQLTTLEDRLRTRFEGGLITDIQPPDLETRIAILMKKAQSDNTPVDRKVLELIASNVSTSIRELEGALIRVAAYSSINDEPITLENATSALRDIIPDHDVEITADSILRVTAEFFDIDVDTLRSATRTRAVAHARQLAMYLCRELTDLSLPSIGKHFGGKDHSTVMYAERKIRKEMTEKRDTYHEIQTLTQMVKNQDRSSERG